MFGFLGSVENDRGPHGVVVLDTGESWPLAAAVTVEGECPQLDGRDMEEPACAIALAVGAAGEVSGIYVLSPPDAYGDRVVVGRTGRVVDDVVQLDGMLNIPLPDDLRSVGMGCALGWTVAQLAAVGPISELTAAVDTDFELVGIGCPTSD